jgi:putative drug exporter of the RND superfamily
VSRDGQSALVLFSMNGKLETSYKRVKPVENAVAGIAAAHPALRVEEFGGASAQRALQDTLGKDFSRAESISIPLTLGILLLAFGALVAALVPVTLGLTAVITASGLLALASQGFHTDESAGTLILLIGLAVGVDYSLFYIRREREERAAGRSREEALAIAAATSGHAILVSGLTVMLSMSAMYLTGVGTFIGMAEGTVLVVAVAVAGSLIALPALLALLGDNLDRGRMPWLGRWMQRRRATGDSRFLRLVLRPVLAHPGVAAVAAGGLLVALALRALGLRTAVLGTADIPPDLPVMKTYSRIQHTFPGGRSRPRSC